MWKLSWEVYQGTQANLYVGVGVARQDMLRGEPRAVAASCLAVVVVVMRKFALKVSQAELGSG